MAEIVKVDPVAFQHLVVLVSSTCVCREGVLNTDATMHVHVHLCTAVYTWSWYIPGLVHDLALYRALERTQ